MKIELNFSVPFFRSVVFLDSCAPMFLNLNELSDASALCPMQSIAVLPTTCRFGGVSQTKPTGGRSQRFVLAGRQTHRRTARQRADRLTGRQTGTQTHQTRIVLVLHTYIRTHTLITIASAPHLLCLCLCLCLYRCLRHRLRVWIASGSFGFGCSRSNYLCSGFAWEFLKPRLARRKIISKWQ